MRISQTASFIREKVPHERAKRIARWVLIFCVGFILGHAADVMPEGWCWFPGSG